MSAVLKGNLDDYRNVVKQASFSGLGVREGGLLGHLGGCIGVRWAGLLRRGSSTTKDPVA